MKPVCVVVVFLSCINVSYTCPSACICFGNTVDCREQNLVEIPFGIPATAHTLDLNSNQITHISPQSIEGLSALTYLDLSSNQITNFRPQTFEGLSALTYLDLNSNQITNIRPQTFEGLSALTTLDLNSNQITNISPQTFEGLSALTSLYLNRNQITNISPQTFEGLSALTSLYLNYNPLNCSSCDLETFKVFLNNQTHLGNTGAKCNGTNTYVVNHDFQNCGDSPSITTENLVLIVAGSVGALALVTGICVCVAYTYSLQNRKSVVPRTI